MALARVLAAAPRDPAGSLSKLGDELFHARAVRRELRRGAVDSRLEDHGAVGGAGTKLYGTFTAPA
jgi:hypothetical protein